MPKIAVCLFQLFVTLSFPLVQISYQHPARNCSALGLLDNALHCRNVRGSFARNIVEVHPTPQHVGAKGVVKEQPYLLVYSSTNSVTST